VSVRSFGMPPDEPDEAGESGAWLTAEEWDACRKPGRALKPEDKIALGLDGSVRDDATALVAVRLSDLHVFPLSVWENPEGAEGRRVRRKRR
jgi:hypothetical protein